MAPPAGTHISPGWLVPALHMSLPSKEMRKTAPHVPEKIKLRSPGVEGLKFHMTCSVAYFHKKLPSDALAATTVSVPSRPVVVAPKNKMSSATSTASASRPC